jgi:hypothetical protein
LRLRRLTLVIALLSFETAAACRGAAERVPRTIGSLEGVRAPWSMAVEGNDLFVAGEDHAVRVHSLEPFSLLFALGAKGEGPRDLRSSPLLWVTEDSIVASDFVKTLRFARDGRFLEAIPYSDFPDFDPRQVTLLFPAGDRYVRTVNNHPERKSTVALFDRERRPIAALYEGLFDWNQTGGPNGFNLLPHRIEVVFGDGEIFVSDTDKGFFIRVFDLDGKERATIDLTATEAAVPVSEGDKARLLEDIRLTRSESVHAFAKANARFPDAFPRVHEMRYADARLYITTHREKGGLHELLVLDTRGKILDRLFLPIRSFHHFRGAVRSDLFDVTGGALYELVQNAETLAWDVLRTDLSHR